MANNGKQRKIVSPEQILRIDGKSEFFEVMVNSMAIDKILIRFIKYDKSAPTGNRQTATIPIYLDVLDAAVIANDILSGRISKLGAAAKKAAADAGYKYPKEVLLRMGGTGSVKANRADQKAEYRGFKITPGNSQPWIFSAETGPGKESEQGLISPDYKAPEAIVRVPLTDDLLKKVACAFQLASQVWAMSKFQPVICDWMEEKTRQTRDAIKAAGGGGEKSAS